LEMVVVIENKEQNDSGGKSQTKKQVLERL